MKTLIFNGSPRKKGNTVALINEVVTRLEGEYKIVDAYYCAVKPCIDCRYCKTHPACSINDGMGEIYEYIKECDNIIIASSLNFAEVTGQLLSVLSRLQMFYCNEVFRKEKLIKNEKRGGIILTGGGDGAVAGAIKTSRIILHHMNVKEIAPEVISHNTDVLEAKDDVAAVSAAVKLAEFLNQTR